MTANSMQGATATNDSTAGQVDSSQGGAGGGQQSGVVAGVPRFNPGSVVDATDGGGNGSESVDAGNDQGKSKAKADAGSGDSGQSEVEQLKAKIAELEAGNEQLKGQIGEAAGKRQQAKAKVEETAQTVQMLTAKLRSRDVVDAALAKLPAARHKLARSVIQGLPNDPLPIQLAGEDAAATVEAVMKRIEQDFPDLLTEPQTGPRIPKVPGPNQGGPQPKDTAIRRDAQGNALL